MESVIALNKLEDSTLSLINDVNINRTFASKEVDRSIRETNLKIKKKFKIDYSQNMKMNSNEEKRIKKMIVEFLKYGKNDFNSYYLQLLAWHIKDIKFSFGKTKKNISILEYNPNPLIINSITNRIFNLFSKKYIESEKVSTALLLTYLNNFSGTSKRFKTVLKSYLKKIKYCEDVDVYFNEANVISYTYEKTQEHITELFPERLAYLKIRQNTINTEYFYSAWFFWMFYLAKLTDSDVLSQLNSKFYKNCDLWEQKILQAKIIYCNNNNLYSNDSIIDILVKYIFPAVKEGNPFEEQYWNITISENYKYYLTTAYKVIKDNIINNIKYKNLVESATRNGKL